MCVHGVRVSQVRLAGERRVWGLNPVTMLGKDRASQPWAGNLLNCHFCAGARWR